MGESKEKTHLLWWALRMCNVAVTLAPPCLPSGRLLGFPKQVRDKLLAQKGKQKEPHFRVALSIFAPPIIQSCSTSQSFVFSVAQNQYNEKESRIY